MERVNARAVQAIVWSNWRDRRIVTFRTRNARAVLFSPRSTLVLIRQPRDLEMALASLPGDFQAWFSAWIINYNDDGDSAIQSFDTMELMSTRACFVTVGATASFHKLIRQVLNEPFFAQLAKYQYTHLLVQYGTDGEKIWDEFNENFPPGSKQLHGLNVTGFDFRPDLWRYMRVASKEGDQRLGIIISHAGMS